MNIQTGSPATALALSNPWAVVPSLGHLDAYISGEEFDPVDGTHHLGNIMACAAILLDAQAAGKLNDDRPPSVDCRATYEFVEEQMTVIREMYAHIEQRPYTIKDAA